MALQLVNVGRKSLADYASLATRGLMDEIRRLAEPLSGKRVAHVSATAFGGGVAEINYTLIPLMQDAGLEVEWRILRGQEEFFNVTKTIHNGLQGNPEGLSEADREVYDRYQRLNTSRSSGVSGRGSPWRPLWIAFVTWKNSSAPRMTRHSTSRPASAISGTSV